MKESIARILTDDAGIATIYYNGENEPMTAENDTICEEIGYTAENLDDAINAVAAMYGCEVWELEMIYN